MVEPSQLFVDNSIRVVVLSEAALFALFSVIVLLRFFYKRPATGSLAWHVICLALFSLFATGYISIDIANQLDRPGVTWRCPLGVLAFGFGDMGMMLMLSRLYFKDKIVPRITGRASTL